MFTPMTRKAAKTISSWTYSGEYSCYSLEQTAATIDEIMDGSYFAALDDGGVVFGFVCFGKSAQIPTIEVGTYDMPALDIGLSLSPSLCGQGHGLRFLKDCLTFGKETFGATSFRLSVACFNKRAIKVYKRVGFTVQCTVQHALSGSSFLVMRLPSLP